MFVETYKRANAPRIATCPDEEPGIHIWKNIFTTDETTNFTLNTAVLIDSDDINVGSLKIGAGGILVFKDHGPDGPMVKIRAKSIEVSDGGQLHIGSRDCRYQESSSSLD